MNSPRLASTLPISEVRRKIFDIARNVQTPGTVYAMTENGRTKAVILSSDEFESLLETVEILHTYPNVQREIQEARKEAKAKNTVSLDDLKTSLLTKTAYVSRRSPKTSRKKPAKSSR